MITPANAMITNSSGRPLAWTSMRLTEFWERMESRFGAAYADSVGRDQVIGRLGNPPRHPAGGPRPGHRPARQPHRPPGAGRGGVRQGRLAGRLRALRDPGRRPPLSFLAASPLVAGPQPRFRGRLRRLSRGPNPAPAVGFAARRGAPTPLPSPVSLGCHAADRVLGTDGVALRRRLRRLGGP